MKKGTFQNTGMTVTHLFFYALIITWNVKWNNAVFPLKQKGIMTVLSVSYMSRVSEQAKPLTKKKNLRESFAQKNTYEVYIASLYKHKIKDA